MRVNSPAKINLFLQVGKRKSDSFHPLLSLVEPINLCDILEFYPSREVKVDFTSPWEIPSDNTITRAVFILKNKFNISEGIEIRIIKRIPAGSGLGGGSSNASATLKTLNKIWKLNLSRKELTEIAFSIGSDVPLFLYQTRCIIGGKGEKVEVVSPEPSFWYFLAIPDFPVSTGKVYNYYDKWIDIDDLTEAEEKIKILLFAIKEKNVKKMEESMFNSLEEVSINLWKEIKEVRDTFEEESGRKFLLSGSGGSLFAVCREKEEAEKLARLFCFRNWSGFVVRSWNKHLVKGGDDGN